jgi:putative Mn2+ efflux pump MntP
MVERSSNAVVKQWLKIIGGSLLTALGLFLLLEAFISLELWQAYTKDGVVHEFGSHLGVIKV